MAQATAHSHPRRRSLNKDFLIKVYVGHHFGEGPGPGAVVTRFNIPSGGGPALPWSPLSGPHVFLEPWVSTIVSVKHWLMIDKLPIIGSVLVVGWSLVHDG